MCGRFVSSTPAAVLAEQFGAEPVPDLPDAPRFNVAPTDPVLAVAPTSGGRRLGVLAWGLVPPWAGDGRRPPRLINLRAETVARRDAFRGLVARRRCIVPADGFYEWAGEPGRRRPVFVTGRDRRPLAFAAVWDVGAATAARATPGAGPGARAGPLRSCAVVTTAPNELVAGVHDRMPAILDPADWDEWLDPALTDPDAVARLLRPYPAERLELWPVGTAVNSVGNDGPHLVERAAARVDRP